MIIMTYYNKLSPYWKIQFSYCVYNAFREFSYSENLHNFSNMMILFWKNESIRLWNLAVLFQNENNCSDNTALSTSSHCSRVRECVSVMLKYFRRRNGGGILRHRDTVFYWCSVLFCGVVLVAVCCVWFTQTSRKNLLHDLCVGVCVCYVCSCASDRRHVCLNFWIQTATLYHKNHDG